MLGTSTMALDHFRWCYHCFTLLLLKWKVFSILLLLSFFSVMHICWRKIFILKTNVVLRRVSGVIETLEFIFHPVIFHFVFPRSIWVLCFIISHSQSRMIKNDRLKGFLFIYSKAKKQNKKHNFRRNERWIETRRDLIKVYCG